MTEWNEIIKEVKPLSNKGSSFINKAKLKLPSRARQQNDINFKQPQYFPTLDLHGLTIDEAYKKCEEFFSLNKSKEIIVITGKSGELKKLFPRWCENGRLKQYVREIKPENNGSYKIKIDK